MGTCWRRFSRLLVPVVQDFPVCAKPGKAAHKIDISKITPPTSPPSRTFGLSTPPENPVEKEKQVHVEVEQIGEGGGGGGGGAGGDVGGDG
ncbi:hypothetical protein HanIR_Chr04g0164031 [Helianthus annuus]|nr:hypothetical protein HanIR_Chr04g0164031 [Helianthus annuus]